MYGVIVIIVGIIALIIASYYFGKAKAYREASEMIGGVRDKFK